MIRDYFARIEHVLHKFPLAVATRFETERVDVDIGFFKARLSLHDGSRLYLFEFVKVKDEPVVVKYRYHFQDVHEELIRRWDNADHHDVATQPEHVHTPDGVEGGAKPDIEDVLEYVAKYID